MRRRGARGGVEAPPRADPRDQGLPRATKSLHRNVTVAPGDDRGGGHACERAAGRGIARGPPTSDTAATRLAFVRSGVGRRPGGSGGTAGNARADGAIANESERGGNVAVGKASRVHRARDAPRVVTQRRAGGALRCALDRGVTTLRSSRFAPPRATAGAPAGAQYDGSSTASESGDGAALQRGASSASVSTCGGS